MTRTAPDRGGPNRLARLPRQLLKAPVHAYRYLLSPLLGPACRFQPTCSAYALEAIETHGALRGGRLALRRLLRCHPFTWLGGSSGYDPVPPKPGAATGRPGCHGPAARRPAERESSC